MLMNKMMMLPHDGNLRRFICFFMYSVWNQSNSSNQQFKTNQPPINVCRRFLFVLEVWMIHWNATNIGGSSTTPEYHPSILFNATVGSFKVPLIEGFNQMIKAWLESNKMQLSKVWMWCLTWSHAIKVDIFVLRMIFPSKNASARACAWISVESLEKSGGWKNCAQS